MWRGAFVPGKEVICMELLYATMFLVVAAYILGIKQPKK
jgi:hypothetical protein